MRVAPLLVALLALAPPAWAQGVAPRLLFDGADQGLNGGNGYKSANNDHGTLAWGEAYILMAYGAMFRAAGEGRYLVKLADHALAVLDRRDAPLGRKDYTGRSRPCPSDAR